MSDTFAVGDFVLLHHPLDGLAAGIVVQVDGAYITVQLDAAVGFLAEVYPNELSKITNIEYFKRKLTERLDDY